ncbi:MAG: HEPN domain-containing protein [Desulfobacterales bacterium]|nr:HEPN domain-containing protein [Desulfobacterales bacterium]
MTPTIYDLVSYRLKRSNDSFEEAKILSSAEHWNACVNRLYYACFYAVSALLSIDNLSSSKHTGIRSFFNQFYVKTEKISKDNASIYNDLFQLRQEGDYFDFLEFKESQVKPLIADVDMFLENIKQIIEIKLRS